MGNKYFSEEDLLKLKESEKGGGEGGGIGAGGLSFIIGLGLIIAGLFYASTMQGKTLHPEVTPMMVAETAVHLQATPTLAPTATATWQPTETATAVPTSTSIPTALPTHTPLPTQTPYPTYTPYPSATWTAQPTLTPQATWTAEPTHTAQPTYTPYPTATATSTDVPTAVPVATDVPLLAPLAVDPPDGGSGPLPASVGILIGSLIILALAAMMLAAYVSHQMRPPTPLLITPEGIPVEGTYGVKLPPPSGQPRRETKNAPVQAPVTPVSPPGAPEVAPVQTEQGAPPETIQVSVTAADKSTDVATMKALCAAWNEILARGEQPSLNKLCTEYFGGKNSERMAIARRAVRWGRAKGLIGNQIQKEVKRNDSTISDPKSTQTATDRPVRQKNRFGIVPTRLRPPRPS